MSAFGIYIIGAIILIAGLAYAATQFDLPAGWIIAGVVILVGLFVMSGVGNTKRRDPPSNPQ